MLFEITKVHVYSRKYNFDLPGRDHEDHKFFSLSKFQLSGSNNKSIFSDHLLDAEDSRITGLYFYRPVLPFAMTPHIADG